MGFLRKIRKAVKNPLSKKSAINPFSKEMRSLTRPLSSKSKINPFNKNAKWGAFSKSNPLNPLSKKSRFNPVVPIQHTKKKFKTNKGYRKGALVVGTVAAAYFTGGASLALQSKIAQAQAQAKARERAERENAGMDAMLDKMYAGESGALQATGDDGWTQNDSGGGDGIPEEQSPVSQAFYSGGRALRGDSRGPGGRAIGAASLAATAGSCAGPASAVIDTGPLIWPDEIFWGVVYCGVIASPFVIAWLFDRLNLGRWKRGNGSGNAS